MDYWVRREHEMPMRPWVDGRQEPIVEHQVDPRCRHGVECEETQGDVEFKKFVKFEPGERLNPGSNKSLTAELRAWRVMGMAKGPSDWDGGVMPRPAEPEQVILTNVTPVKAVMPSGTGRGVRSCSIKLARAEFYGPSRVRTGGQGGRGYAGAVNEIELAKIRKELGI